MERSAQRDYVAHVTWASFEFDDFYVKLQRAKILQIELPLLTIMVIGPILTQKNASLWIGCDTTSTIPKQSLDCNHLTNRVEPKHNLVAALALQGNFYLFYTPTFWTSERSKINVTRRSVLTVIPDNRYTFCSRFSHTFLPRVEWLSGWGNRRQYGCVESVSSSLARETLSCVLSGSARGDSGLVRIAAVYEGIANCVKEVCTSREQIPKQ